MYIYVGVRIDVDLLLIGIPNTLHTNCVSSMYSGLNIAPGGGLTIDNIASYIQYHCMVRPAPCQLISSTTQL
jgi:hypothetical protein